MICDDDRFASTISALFPLERACANAGMCDDAARYRPLLLMLLLLLSDLERRYAPAGNVM